MVDRAELLMRKSKRDDAVKDLRRALELPEDYIGWSQYVGTLPGIEVKLTDELVKAKLANALNGP